MYAVAIGGPPTRLSDLLELLHRPAWMADAACREHPEVEFFPTRGQSTRPAKAVCANCLVRQECAAYAVEHNADGGSDGIWGGLTAHERRPLRRVAS